MVLYALASVPGLTYYHSALILLGVSVVFLFMGVAIPETPWWLVYESVADESDVITRIRETRVNLTHAQAYSEYDVLVLRQIELSEASFFSRLKIAFSVDNLITFFIITTLFLLQDLGGGGSIVESYASQIFQASGTPSPNLVSTYSVGLSLSLSTALSAILILKVSRRTLLLVSFGGMFIWLCVLGTQGYFNRDALCHRGSNGSVAANTPPTGKTVCNQHLYPIAIVGVSLFTFFYSIGLGPIPTIMVADLPVKIGKLAATLVDSIRWPVAALVVGGTPSYAEAVGLWMFWYTLAAVNFAGLIFVILVVKDTNEETVEDFKKKFCCCIQSDNKS